MGHPGRERGQPFDAQHPWRRAAAATPQADRLLDVLALVERQEVEPVLAGHDVPVDDAAERHLECLLAGDVRPHDRHAVEHAQRSGPRPDRQLQLQRGRDRRRVDGALEREPVGHALDGGHLQAIGFPRRDFRLELRAASAVHQSELDADVLGVVRRLDEPAGGQLHAGSARVVRVDTEPERGLAQPVAHRLPDPDRQPASGRHDVGRVRHDRPALRDRVQPDQPDRVRAPVHRGEDGRDVAELVRLPERYGLHVEAQRRVRRRRRCLDREVLGRQGDGEEQPGNGRDHGSRSRRMRGCLSGTGSPTEAATRA